MADKLSMFKSALHLTYQKIADATGVSLGTVEHYVKGIVPPPEDWLKRFCEYYHVEMPDDEVRFLGQPNVVELRDSSRAGERLRQLREEFISG